MTVASSRRTPLSIHGLRLAIAWWLLLPAVNSLGSQPDNVLAEFRDPPREFSIMPFWFWNDDLKEDELRRQIADFEAHGVYGFTIHPRIGLPNHIGWMSPRMIQCMKFAVEEAERRKMYVILYDDGMYPSGSASGQVVEKNPAHAARGLVKIDLRPSEQPKLPEGEGWNLVAVLDRPGGQRLAVADRPSGGVLRGLHYIGEGSTLPQMPGWRAGDQFLQDYPPAADILNPEAVRSFIDLVHNRYAHELGRHFGKTVLAIFTDEPVPQGFYGMGMPGTTGILKEVNRILGYDFTPYLGDLWYNDRPDSPRRRADYHRAIAMRLEETYYRPISQWCQEHGVALTGHPAASMDIGMERSFQIPGQDMVGRMILPGKTALEGEDSTMAKCASSAMIHLGRRRNLNEIYGAYGHEFTFDEMEWCANWTFVRGQNWLVPGSFFYSIRGPRVEERPPDVGPHALWWPKYKPFADACRRLSWLNTDSRHVCRLAILGDTAYLPYQAAKVCYENQRDFNYLEQRHLWEDATVDAGGVHLAGMDYSAVLLDRAETPDKTVFPPEHGPGLAPPSEFLLHDKGVPALARLASAERLLVWGDSSAALKQASLAKTPGELVAAIDRVIPRDLSLEPAIPDIRYRHVTKLGWHFYIIFNEGPHTVAARLIIPVSGRRLWLDPSHGETADASLDQPVAFRPHELRILAIAR